MKSWLCEIWNNVNEFFQGEDGALSMTRLMVFLSYFPAAYVAVATKSETMASAILTAYVVQYGIARFHDVKQTKANADATATVAASTAP